MPRPPAFRHRVPGWGIDRPPAPHSPHARRKLRPLSTSTGRGPLPPWAGLGPGARALQVHSDGPGGRRGPRPRDCGLQGHGEVPASQERRQPGPLVLCFPPKHPCGRVLNEPGLEAAGTGAAPHDTSKLPQAAGAGLPRGLQRAETGHAQTSRHGRRNSPSLL